MYVLQQRLTKIVDFMLGKGGLSPFWAGLGIISSHFEGLLRPKRPAFLWGTIAPQTPLSPFSPGSTSAAIPPRFGGPKPILREFYPLFGEFQAQGSLHCLPPLPAPNKNLWRGQMTVQPTVPAVCYLQMFVDKSERGLPHCNFFGAFVHDILPLRCMQ